MRIDPEIPEYLIGDPGRLRQVLVNLVGNAIKFTEVGEIAIDVSIASGPPTEDRYNLLFSVRDTGIGIAQDKQSAVFAAFTQADASTTRRYGGTGLGLAISSQLIEMLGGRIWLDSQLGQGTTFYFTLGLVAAEGQSVGSGSYAGPTWKSLRGLVIDDNPTNLVILQEQLSRHHVQVATASSVDLGLDLWLEFLKEKTPFDFVIVDRMMPYRDGFEFVQAVRDHRAPDGSIPSRPVIIMLTSSNQAADLQRVRELGIALYLQKPVLQSELMEALERSLPIAESRPEPLPKNNPQQAMTTRSLSILLAEDGAVNRAVMVELLKRSGHQVTCVEDGQAAIETWRNARFDAIFMDVQMPVMDGLEATRRIRSEEHPGSRIPIIAITAAAMRADQERCLQAGMDDYISKPIDFNELRRILLKLSEVEQGTSTRLFPDIPYTFGVSPAVVREKVSLIDFNAPFAALSCPPDQQRQLVETLRRETQQRLDEIALSIRTNDVRLLVRASHSLKSAAGLFEAQGVVLPAAEIELAARAGNIDAIDEKFGHLRSACHAMLAEIDRWLSTQSFDLS